MYILQILAAYCITCWLMLPVLVWNDFDDVRRQFYARAPLPLQTPAGFQLILLLFFLLAPVTLPMCVEFE